MTNARYLVILAAVSIGTALVLSGCSSGSPPSQVQAVVRVSVEDVEGAPVTGATVKITIGGQEFVGTEGEGGVYDVTVTVAPGGADGNLEVTLPDGGGKIVQPIAIDDPRNPPAPTIAVGIPEPPSLPEM